MTRRRRRADEPAPSAASALEGASTGPATLRASTPSAAGTTTRSAASSPSLGLGAGAAARRRQRCGGRGARRLGGRLGAARRRRRRRRAAAARPRASARRRRPRARRAPRRRAPRARGPCGRSGASAAAASGTSRSSRHASLAQPRAVLRAEVAHEHGAAARGRRCTCSREASASSSGEIALGAAADRRRRGPPRASASDRALVAALRRRAPRRAVRAHGVDGLRRRARGRGRAWPRRGPASPGCWSMRSSSQTRPTRTRSPDRTMREVRGATRTPPTNVPLVLPSSTSAKSAALRAKRRVAMADARVGEPNVAARAPPDDDALGAVERQARVVAGAVTGR